MIEDYLIAHPHRFEPLASPEPIIQWSTKTNWKNVAASKRAAKKRRKYLAKQPK